MERSRSRDIFALGIALGVPLLAGSLVGIATRQSISTWYRTLRKPSWNPPDRVFGPVWTLLYVGMGVASWLVWRRGTRDKQVRGALTIYAAQLALNLLWSIIFFGLRRLDLAVAEIGVLWSFILETRRRFSRVDPVAGLILIPYQLWTTFAGALNISVWRMNR